MAWTLPLSWDTLSLLFNDLVSVNTINSPIHFFRIFWLMIIRISIFVWFVLTHFWHVVVFSMAEFVFTVLEMSINYFYVFYLIREVITLCHILLSLLPSRTENFLQRKNTNITINNIFIHEIFSSYLLNGFEWQKNILSLS